MTRRPSFADPIVGALALAVALAVVHFLMHRGSYPEHDTYYVFQAFKTVYESILAGGGTPTWLPEVQYGAPSHVYLFPALTPWQYLTAHLGGWIGIGDVLTLFHLSVALELVFFLIGGALLTARLTSGRGAPIAMFVLIAGLTTITHLQIWYNLRIVAFLPWIFFFLRRFQDEGALFWLPAATLTAMIWLAGNIFYFLPIALLTLVVGLIMTGPEGWRRVRPAEAFAPPFTILVIANVAYAGCLLAVYLNIFDDVVLHSPLRRADGVTDIDVFLTYGGNLDPRKFLELLLAAPHNPDALFYLGATPLLFALYAPWTSAAARAKPYLWTAALFIAFSLPGLTPIADALYTAAPGMRYFRHIGLIIALAKFCLLVAAAIGFDGFLTDRRRPGGDLATREVGVLALILAGLGLAAYIAFGVGYGVYPPAQMYPDLPAAFGPPDVAVIAPLAALAILAWTALAARPGRPGPSLAAVVTALALVEGMAYARFHYWATESNNPPAIRSAFNAAELRFPPPRTQEITGIDAKLAAFYGDYYPLEAMLSRPRCIEPGRRDARVQGVADLIEARDGAPIRPGEKPEPNLADPALARALGCERPRLRLTNQVAQRRSDDEALAQVVDGPGFGALVSVVCPADAADCETPSPWKLVDEPVAAERYAMDSISAIVRVEQPGGNWLIYADAWTPSWRATIDGTAWPVRRADLAFKAVHVPQGEHRVVFFHDPSPALTVGYHGLMAIALGWFALLGRLVRRPPPPHG